MSKATYIPAPQPVRPLISGNRKGAGARPGNRNALRHGLCSAAALKRRKEVWAVLTQTRIVIAQIDAHVRKMRAERKAKLLFIENARNNYVAETSAPPRRVDRAHHVAFDPPAEFTRRDVDKPVEHAPP